MPSPSVLTPVGSEFVRDNVAKAARSLQTAHDPQSPISYSPWLCLGPLPDRTPNSMAWAGIPVFRGSSQKARSIGGGPIYRCREACQHKMLCLQAQKLYREKARLCEKKPAGFSWNPTGFRKPLARNLTAFISGFRGREAPLPLRKFQCSRGNRRFATPRQTSTPVVCSCHA